MQTYKNFYPQIYDLKNLTLAYKKAKKEKKKKYYIKEFEKNLAYNLKVLHDELKNHTYKPRALETFILRDPKTRKISKSNFRDRIIHHAIILILEPIFDPIFIHDSCANRIGKGNLFAIRRFEKFLRKVSRNGKLNGWFNNNQVKGYCLKADIKHYFEEIDHEILLSMIKRKIKDKKVIWLIKQILESRERDASKIKYYFDKKGMPLGNLTSQFFANLYLNELDYFIKYKLKAKYYLRYVDDFAILHSSKSQLRTWKQEIEKFLKEKLKIELHSQKSRIIPLSKPIDFVGFRNFYYFKLLRRRNLKTIQNQILLLKQNKISYQKFIESFQGWNAYAKWTNSHKITRRLIISIP